MTAGYHGLGQISTIRRRFAARVARMTPEKARETLAAIAARGATIEHPEIRDLTGGFASQALNGQVIRRLAQRAGILPKGA